MLVKLSPGGVILVGGQSSNEPNLQTLFRLSDAANSNWVKMPHKLTTGRYGHGAFLVSDDITSCKREN